MWCPVDQENRDEEAPAYGGDTIRSRRRRVATVTGRD
ncbi:hypothetical protein Ae168Ps1_3784 [Pseudonocardia sp. Ae168_Ps1]|nr:hypothetical protein Ae150APs1_3761 [Pseudonocardia sp. Ae150A_Ps1]OLL81378.1 hypothetical protein Ae168Ps1_3784 [Pseudonocardia sp. Ae168_Ps1]OLL84508.1 hypothetical protein Ae263Ps1_1563c [Pseudonocardia sp. Ae263_Ps1]OLL95472.1 hypothetical protein Ae356Ps1_5369 [Pseudonocardia sp. Ae356_Ps1]